MKKTILIIDDQPWQVRQLKEELEEEFFCLDETDPVGAASLIQNGASIEAIVLDIMMPSPSEGLIVKTKCGLDTGVWFLDHMSDFLVSMNIPVVIYSNRIVDTIRERISSLPYPEGQISIYFKQSTADQIVRIELRRMIEGRSKLPGLKTEYYLNAVSDECPHAMSVLVNRFAFFSQLKQEVSSSGLAGILKATGFEFTPIFERYLAAYLSFSDIPGFGPRFATLLINSCDIFSLSSLAERSPEEIWERIRNYNSSVALVEVGFEPSLSLIASWVRVARMRML